MRLARPLAATAALLLLAGCTSPDNTTSAETAPSSPPSTSAASPAPGPATSATSSTAHTPTQAAPKQVTPTPAPAESTASTADVVVAVVVKAGKVTPNGANVRVEDGQRVQVSLDSDATESIHVHGYDKTVEVKPGGTDQVTFVADQKGVFEVETHETEKLVAKLIVS